MGRRTVSGLIPRCMKPFLGHWGRLPVEQPGPLGISGVGASIPKVIKKKQKSPRIHQKTLMPRQGNLVYPLEEMISQWNLTLNVDYFSIWKLELSLGRFWHALGINRIPNDQINIIMVGHPQFNLAIQVHVYCKWCTYYHEKSKS